MDAPAPITNQTQASDPSSHERCLNCNYDLAKLAPIAICPECGDAFNKSELRLHWHRRQMRWLVNDRSNFVVPQAAKRVTSIPVYFILPAVLVVVILMVDFGSVSTLVVGLLALLGTLAILFVAREIKLIKHVRRVDCVACLNCAIDLRGMSRFGDCPLCETPYNAVHTRQVWGRWLNFRLHRRACNRYRGDSYQRTPR